jgi:hypothetical protein
MCMVIAFVVGFIAFPVACIAIMATFDENLME